MPQQVGKISAMRPRKDVLWLGFLGGLIAQLSKTAPPAVTCADLQRQNYSTSTQRLGVRFTERVRNVFRLRWIREIF